MKRLIFASLAPFLSALLLSCASGEKKEPPLSVNVDFAANAGKIKPLNGVNLGPSIQNESAGLENRDVFYALNTHSVRLHDVSLVESGLQIVDTDMVFPLFHADSSDPKNYIFKPTDDYIKASTAKGSKIVYRLGVSIDHSKAKYRTSVPEAKKWADICCHIIAHYNEGWANGHKMGIEYWEIWNEPNTQTPDGSKPMWNGSLDQYNEFYCTVAKIIKKRFPNIKIGGPAHTGASSKLMEPLFKKIAETKAPLDFYSWHCYGKKVEDMASQVFKVKKCLEKFGLKDTELHLNEWHYFPLRWIDIHAKGSDKKAMYDKMRDIESGVFSAATMTAWQDTPLDEANFYGYSIQNWGLIDPFGTPYTSYYPFKAFGEIVKYQNRVKTQTSNPNVYALAGKDSGGKEAVLISLFKTGKCSLEVKFKNQAENLDAYSILICTDKKKLEPADNVKIAGDSMFIPIDSDSACVLIKSK